MNTSDITQGIRCLCMHPLRTFLSALGVLFGVASVITMLAIGEGSKQEILAQIEQLGTNNLIIRESELSEEQKTKATVGWSLGLTVEDAQALKTNISLIQKKASLKAVKGSLGGMFNDVSPDILAVSAEFGDIRGLELAEGRFLSDFDLLQHKQVCVLGSDIAVKLGKSGHVGQHIRIENRQFHVIGVLNNVNWVGGKTKVLNTRNVNKSLFIPLGTEKGFPQQTPSRSHALSEIILQFPSSAHIATGAEAVKRMMELMHKGVEDYQMIIPYELLDQANKTQHTFNLILGGIAAISLLVGGVGIMNIMLATISARTREIGIRRAIGANQYHIAKQFLIETLILTLGGAFLGLIGGLTLSYFIGIFAGWTVIITGWSIFLALGMAIFVGVVSGLYPAFKAASMDPLIALRHIGH